MKTRKENPMQFEADRGYDGEPNNNLYSSPCYYAHALGVYFMERGMNRPRDVRMSRGHSIRANGMLFRMHDDGRIERIS